MTQSIKKKPHSSAYKFRVALAALKGDKTVSDLCQEFGLVSSQIYKWKTALMAQSPGILTKGALVLLWQIWNLINSMRPLDGLRLRMIFEVERWADPVRGASDAPAP